MPEPYLVPDETSSSLVIHNEQEFLKECHFILHPVSPTAHTSFVATPCS